MKITSKIWLIGLIASILVLLGAAGVAAYQWFPRPPVQAAVPAPDYWPTQGWRTSTPEEQGFELGQAGRGT